MAEDQTLEPARQTQQGRRAGVGRWLAVAALVAVALVAIYIWRTAGRESTDDAQVDGHITQVSARVGGTVAKVNVKENDHVEAGAVLIELDSRDYPGPGEPARADPAHAAANGFGAVT